MNFEIKDIDSNNLDLSKYSGKVVLIVNVASKCGLTFQYEQLQHLYAKFRDSRFEVIGVPCNQFNGQESGTHQEIKEFCSTTYNVEFTLTEKVDVKGPNQHPLYKWLVETNPINNTEDIMSWNFTKFLINKKGEVVHVFNPWGPNGWPDLGHTPEELEAKIIEELKK
jgi:glutathione peroxidase